MFCKYIIPISQHFSDTIKVSPDVPAYQNEIRRSSGNER